MESSTFYLYMSILATLAFLVNVWAAISSHLNAWRIQLPWYKNYLTEKEEDETP